MGRIRVAKRRRREAKTDYKLRLTLLKSNKPRIVVRTSNKYITVQAVESVAGQDAVKINMTSQNLVKEGLDKKFSGSLKSIPASYLTGLAFAKKCDAKTEYIIDLGMTRTLSGNRVFAVVKGLVDGGVNINVGEDVFPSEDRINGEHLSEDAKKAFKTLKEKL
ncbi:MAG: large subunit ribosomal protein L18 [Patescibacteria group bacterium]|jgi:large subunit ribosomal protein L18